jgi:hypothetical protein
MGRCPVRLLTATAAVSVLALAGASSAGAAGGKEQIHLTAEGQTAARAAVLEKSDFRSSTSWVGKSFKPDVAAAGVGCAGFRPKVSDLVVNGAAETSFSPPGSVPLLFDSLAEVLRTPHMVALDWQRTVASPRLVDCLGQEFSAFFTAARFVSIKRLAFPHVAQHTAAFRAEFVETSARRLHFVFDTVIVSRGRTEITLSTTAPFSQQASVAAAEVSLVKQLLARARA